MHELNEEKTQFLLKLDIQKGHPTTKSENNGINARQIAKAQPLKLFSIPFPISRNSKSEMTNIVRKSEGGHVKAIVRR